MAELQCNKFRGGKGKVILTTIPNNAAFQTEDLDAYDSDCDDVSNAKAVLMANLSSYGYDVLSEVPHSDSYLNDMDNQSVHAIQDFEQTPVVDFSNNEIYSDSNIISALGTLAPWHQPDLANGSPMNQDVQKLSQLVLKMLVMSRENDEDWVTRVEILFRTHTRRDFKHKSAWLFLKDKHKWKNPESTLARRNRLRDTDEEPEHFREDVLPRPPGAQRIAKSQYSSNSTASFGSNPAMY
ncbi:hypothetical protein Tco_1063142 [Tanacetum coccineum]